MQDIFDNIVRANDDDEVEGYGQYIGQFPMTAPIPVRPRRPGDKSFAMVPYAQAQAVWSKDPYYPPLR